MKMKYIVLPIICLLLAGALALAYNVTLPTINAINLEISNAAMKEVLPNADEFTKVDKTFDESLEVIEMQKANNGEGYAVQMATAGYGGEMTLMVGIDKEGKVSGVQILTHGETPGLGARVTEDAFRDQYTDKTGELTVTKGDASSDTEIKAVSSATKSSNAVTLAVNNAQKAVSEVKEG